MNPKNETLNRKGVDVYHMTKKKKKKKDKEVRTKESIEKYLEEIGGFSPLPPEQEISLACRIRKGDEDALDHLVKANLRFVVTVAKKYQNQGLSLSDLISEGNIGLMMAIARFDTNKGCHLITYALWWIRQAILKAIYEKSRMIRLPPNLVLCQNSAGSPYVFSAKVFTCSVRSNAGVIRFQ